MRKEVVKKERKVRGKTFRKKERGTNVQYEEIVLNREQTMAILFCEGLWRT